MYKTILSVTFCWILAGASLAQNASQTETLFRALGLPEVLEIMREEGLGFGEDIQADLLEGRGGDRWHAAVDRVYDLDWMQGTVQSRMLSELDGQDLAPMLAFFESDLGKRIVQLEVSARTAFLDEDIEQASKDAASDLPQSDGARFELISDLVVVADLVETNVASALTANLAFFKGMQSGGALPYEMSEEQMLAQVWSQEAEIREDTTEWLLAYLSLAYRPLSNEDLQAYIAFFESEAGQSLNTAVFAAVDEMIVKISSNLGKAASGFLAGEEL